MDFEYWYTIIDEFGLLLRQGHEVLILIGEHGNELKKIYHRFYLPNFFESCAH